MIRHKIMFLTLFENNSKLRFGKLSNTVLNRNIYTPMILIKIAVVVFMHNQSSEIFYVIFKHDNTFNNTAVLIEPN